MEYIKKVLVLSQIADGFNAKGKRLSGICRIEITEGVATFYLSTVNFSAVNSGSFIAFIMDEKKKLYSFDLGLKPTSITKVFDNPPIIERGFCAGISFIKDDIPILVAFAKSDNFFVSASDFKKAVLDRIISAKKRESQKPVLPPIPLPSPERQSPDNQPTDVPNKLNFKYDDEAVATENYYEKDLDFMQKLKIIENLDGEYVRAENGISNLRSQAETEKIKVETKLLERQLSVPDLKANEDSIMNIQIECNNIIKESLSAGIVCELQSPEDKVS